MSISVIDAGIEKKNKHDSGTTILIISNEETADIMKIVQALEDSNISLKEVSETIKNDLKSQHGGAPGKILDTLAEIY